MTRPRKLDADLDEYLIDALLANWARWARESAAHLDAKVAYLPASSGTDEQQDPHMVLPIDIDSAEDIEAVLVQMRARRPKLWKAIVYRYLARWTDITAAHRMRVCRDEYRALMLRAYAWVDSMLH